eukprot:GHVL01025717.1.p1 GENE.GHVL01025717.1~~GHVL01025717.1.p1  ORF type:complete len:474 (+),score=96.58 GHVL01025717.1:93-1514(+)
MQDERKEARLDRMEALRNKYEGFWRDKQYEWKKKRAARKLLRNERLIIRILDEDENVEISSQGFDRFKLPKKNIAIGDQLEKIKDRSGIKSRLNLLVKNLGLNFHKVKCANKLSFCTLEVGENETESAMEAVNQSGEALYVEPDQILEAFGSVNDPDFFKQWGLQQIQAVEAWTLENERFGAEEDEPVIVAIIDSGVDFWHLDLEDNIWFNEDEIPFDGKDNDNNGMIDDAYGWNFFDDDNFPMDDAGHGTHSAGTIGAITNNKHGMAGLASRHALIMPCKFMDGFGQGFLSGAIDCIDYAVLNNAKIISASWGGRLHSQAMEDAIAEAHSYNVLTVAAAGNSRHNLDDIPVYPASLLIPSIISVIASDEDDKVAKFTNFGAISTHIAAPGVDIWSTSRYDSFEAKSGSSMSAPFVAAAAAFLWNRFPELSNVQVKNLILASVEQNSALSGKCLTGGRLNVYRMLQMALQYHG